MARKHETPADKADLDERTDTFVERVLANEEIAAERLIAWVRIIAAFSVGLTYFITIETLEWLDLIDEPAPPPMRGAGPGFAIRGLIVMFLLFGSGILALYLARRKRWRGWMSYAFAALDAGMLIFAILRPLMRYDLTGAFAPVASAAFAVPFALAMGSLRPQPRVQLTFIALFAGGLIIGLAEWGYPLAPPDQDVAGRLSRFFDVQSNITRLLMLIAAGLTIAFGVSRSRALLRRSITESERRKTLTRFLPSEIAPLISEGRFDALRRGQRRTATVLFADIRNSTALAEGLDPQRLSVFISAFRRRVMRATVANGGIIDKFIGDGALVLFGVLDEDNSGAAQAIACARDLHALIDRWNDKRKFSPQVRVGIGIHTGEVYVGVVGDEHRLEFTVLGDSVNTAARLEQLTKTIGAPMLVSGATLDLAGGSDGWTLVGKEPLRGRSGELPYYAPQDGPRWLPAPSAGDPA